MIGAAWLMAACAVGPDYQKPEVVIPTSFKEGVDWQRAQVNPQASLSSTWWLDYNDPKLTELIEQSFKANQSIAQAEAAYRLAQATVEASRASFFPTIGAEAAGTRVGFGSGAAQLQYGSSALSGAYNTINVNATASWELDLWGQFRRELESSKASAQASDAQLAGERLSIAASIATDYFELRQADIDIDLLKQQEQIDSRILEMTRASYTRGISSSDDVLNAQDTLELVVALLQSTQTSREQDEHAIAVLIGVPPGNFSLEPNVDYAFAAPAVPLALPSQLLERRYDVVSAERTAAAANAKIGVAEAAFFPTLTLSAEGGFEHNALANLFMVPNRFWTLGPTLAGTIFDGGARTAAVHEARATYDEDVAAYRQAVLGAFENVEDSLSSWNHLQQQQDAYAKIYQRNQQLFSSEHAQFTIGTASEQDLLNQQLTLLTARENLVDTQALLTEASVVLIKNLGGGWQWDDASGHAANAVASAAQAPVAASGSTLAPQ
ncbi:efflux transporter outer membrane subunit [Paraburkholderia sp. B3]|uniref:efflux transporter outer membrane subunit n=1 Tax=Paraburkholderia sp. B3 TaxID=3134791 RepID=UPI003981E47C